jgi:hypothetical protein
MQVSGISTVPGPMSSRPAAKSKGPDCDHRDWLPISRSFECRGTLAESAGRQGLDPAVPLRSLSRCGQGL